MAWSTTSRHARGYGRAHEKMREQLLRTVVTCEECDRNGIVRAGTIADHIVPLARGGTGDRSNYRLLCKRCHDAKSQGERSQHGVAHPEWLRKPHVPVVIVCGPPGAGKTTYAQAQAASAPQGQVIDLDEIVLEQTGVHGHDQDRSGSMPWLSAALYERNRRLAELSEPTARGSCWFIVGAPTPAERAWWEEKLGGDVVLLNPGEDVCRKRVDRRRHGSVTEWFEAAEQPWRKPAAVPQRAKGSDAWGRPTDPDHPWNRR